MGTETGQFSSQVFGGANRLLRIATDRLSREQRERQVCTGNLLSASRCMDEADTLA